MIAAAWLILSGLMCSLQLSPGSFPKPLTPKEEAYYLAVLKGADKEKAKDAKDKLIMHNLRLVAHITKKYQNSPEDAEDYISIGIIGLIKAIDTFDSKRGRLATYACRCIDNELLMMLRTKKKICFKNLLGNFP